MKQEPCARRETPAGAKAEAEVARTKRPAAQDETLRIVLAGGGAVMSAAELYNLVLSCSSLIAARCFYLPYD